MAVDKKPLTGRQGFDVIPVGSMLMQVRIGADTMTGMLGWSAAALALAAAMPAGADVKAGVDAWAQGDYRTAVEQWRGPAIAGDPDAQFNLGQAYKLGRGVPLDPALAESWFRKAALLHHPQAEDNYGLALYQSGRKADAIPWLEKSIARGEPRAELVLGTMLFNGDAVSRDVPRAYALMTRASQAGLKAASETLAQMDGYVSPADREKGTVLAGKLAAEQGAAAAGGTAARVLVAGGAPVAAEQPPSPATAPKRALPSRPVRPEPAARAAPASGPQPRPAMVEQPASTGRYRVQLGAFRDQGNAQALWSRVGSRIGGNPDYVKVGDLTRLVGGRFATEAAAQRACRAAGVGCIVTR